MTCGTSLEIPGAGPTTLLNEAIRSGWDFRGRTVNDLSDITCPEHSRYSQGRTPWEVGCYNCDWFLAEEAEEANDPSMMAYTEDEAKDAARQHNCEDWRDEWPDIFIRSPEEIAQREEEIQQRQYQRKVAERQAEKQRASDLAVERYRNKEAARYRMIMDFMPLIIALWCVSVILGVLVGLLGN